MQINRDFPLSLFNRTLMEQHIKKAASLKGDCI